MRFQLIDSVIERSDERIVATKNVTAAEEYLGDHFPGFPVLPGVMMLEAMTQAARALLQARPDAPEGPWTLAEVRQVKYGSMVRPGQQLRVTVELGKQEGDRWSFKGTGEVEGRTAVSARFTLRPAAVKVTD